MFWKANKTAFIVLLIGLVASFAAYFIIGSGPDGDIEKAKQLLSTGICAALFAAAALSFMQAKRTPGLRIPDELTEQHFEQMASLEAQYYGEDNITPPAEAYRWYKRYPATTIAAAVGDQIVAFINLFPVKAEIYDALRAGQFNDHTLTLEGLADPHSESDEPLHMFLCCVLTEPAYRGLGLTRHLLSLAVEQYEPVQHRCRRIITDNVTPEGAAFSRHYGFEQVQTSDHNSLIFEQDYADFVAHVTGSQPTSDSAD
ncbi:MAG: GNAT family N-acetyltransferase [Akkermansia sp.]|nr:GNAT family N-acetyltransferase [Akkermansia sp.]